MTGGNETASSSGAGAGLGGRLPTLVASWRGGGSRGLGDREIESVGAALLRLQRGLTGKRELAGAPYMEEPGLLGAYLLYYWPVSYLQASLAIAELGLRPGRVLDLGSGPGPVAAAALDAGGTSVDLADSSARALELAGRVLARDSGRITASRVNLESPEAPGAAGPYDLVVLGHCLNELWRGEADRIARRAALLSRAAELLAPGGAILAIEPALLETSRELLAVRDRLAEEGHPILGPCPPRAGGAYPCPALASGPGRTCHSEAAWDPPEPVASLAGRAGLDRRSVKYSWFAIGGAVASSASGEPSNEARAARDQADGNSVEGRVVSDPMLNKAGRIRYLLCSGGSLLALSAAKDSPEARRSGFASLRRGDVLRIKDPERREGGGLGLGPGSSIELAPAAPRILP